MEIKDKEPLNLTQKVHGLTKGVPTNLFSSHNCNQIKDNNNEFIYLKSKGKTIKLDKNFINWLVGFTDAEGNFHISLKGLQGNKYNNLNLIFQIGLHEKDLAVLEFIKNKLNCGSISKTNGKCNFFISDQKSILDVVLPIFDSVELKSSKYFQYLVFKKAADLLINKEHLTLRGRIEILKYYHEMKIVNLNSIARENMIINKYWLLGFTEGDGCFSSNKLKPKLKYENHIKEFNLFNSILSFLNHGLLYTSERKDSKFVILEINNINILMNIIIPLFNEGMLTKKSLDFKDWSIIVNITYLGYHSLSEGKELIDLIKSCMNNHRLNKVIDNDVYNLIQDKLKFLLSLPSPYEVKNGILFIRGTDKLVSKKFKIEVIDNKGKVQYFSSISECSLNLNISSKVIKNSLIKGIPHNNYIFKFDSIIK